MPLRSAVFNMELQTVRHDQVTNTLGYPGGSIGKESACDAGDLDLIPGLGEGNGYTLQYSCLENSIDRGA